MFRQKLAASLGNSVSRTAERFFRLKELHGKPSRFVATKLVERLVPVAGVISFIPGSAFFLSSLELAMMVEIAKIYNVDPADLNKEMVLAQLGLRYGVSQGAAYLAESLDFIPVAGNLAKGVVGAGVVYAIGVALVRYFEARYPGSVFSGTSEDFTANTESSGPVAH